MSNFRLYEVLDLDKKIESVLGKMMRAGFMMNKKVLIDLGKQVDKKLHDLEKKVFKVIGCEFNLHSSREIAKILFLDLQLPHGKKGKTGFSTDELTLRKIKKLHPLVPLILEHRTLSKLKSTYLEALARCIGNDGRVHSTFLADKAATGRLVSRNPNLQNIPIRGAWGEKIRKAFIVPPGKLLIAADYSQIDLRVLAHFSQEPKLIQAFEQDEDIHLTTAVEIFNKKAEKITVEDRRIAKTVNFGIIYGMSAHGLSETLEIDEKKAAYFIKTYFHKYPKVKEFLDHLKGKALEDGYTETLAGQRRYIAELKSENYFVRRAGERMAINFPIQGSAAEIIKLAMVAIEMELKKCQLLSEMILQVHDELLFEVVKRERETLISIVKDRMENVVRLLVPLKVSIMEGKNWGEMREIKD